MIVQFRREFHEQRVQVDWVVNTGRDVFLE